MESKERMIIEVLLQELRTVKRTIITASGISSEKTVQSYLNPVVKNIVDIIEATEQELEKQEEV